VSHFGLFAIYIKKYILRQKKKKNYGNSNIYFTMQKYNLQNENRLRETKILQDIIYNSIITNLKFQQTLNPKSD
jgi:hypothetical protein